MLERLSAHCIISKNISMKFPTPLPLYHNAPSETAKREWVANQLPQIQKIAQKMVDHINHISFKTFLHQLRRTINDFNTKVSEPYILCVYTGQGESDLWVAQLALEYGNLERYPAAIVNPEELEDVLKKFTHIKHVLMLDDCAYSGGHLQDAAADVVTVTHQQGCHLYFGVPYISSYAKEKIDKLSEHTRVTLLNHVSIPLLSEILEWDERATLNLYGFEFGRQTLTYFDHCAGDAISLLPSLIDGSNLFRIWIYPAMHAIGYYRAESKNDKLVHIYAPTIPVETPEEWSALIQAKFPSSQPIIPWIFKPYRILKEAKEFETALAKGRLGRRNSTHAPAELKDIVPKAEPSLSSAPQSIVFKEESYSGKMGRTEFIVRCAIL